MSAPASNAPANADALTDGDARALDRAVKPLLQQKRKAGWTSEQQVELLRQRWLADADQSPLVPNILGRTADSAWPQLAKIRKLVGEDLFNAGRRIRGKGEEQRAKFISDVNDLRGISHADGPPASASADDVAEQRAAAAATSALAKHQTSAKLRLQEAARHERKLREQEAQVELQSSTLPVPAAKLEFLQKAFPAHRPSVLAAAFRESKVVCRDLSCDCCGKANLLDSGPMVPDRAMKTIHAERQGWLCHGCICTVDVDECRRRVDQRISERSAAEASKRDAGLWMVAVEEILGVKRHTFHVKTEHLHHAEYRLGAPPGCLPANCRPAPANCRPVECGHGYKPAGQLLCDKCISQDANACNICAAPLSADGTCRAEYEEREWHTLHWYTLTDGIAIPTTPVVSPFRLTWTSMHNVSDSSQEKPFAVLGSIAHTTLQCSSCGSERYPHQPCLYCEMPEACIGEDDSAREWACTKCYSRWSSEHGLNDSSDALIMECSYCHVWSKGVRMMHPATGKLTGIINFNEGLAPIPSRGSRPTRGFQALEASLKAHVGSLPRRATVALHGPWRDGWTCSSCYMGFIDELPTKECAFCRYHVCQDCAASVRCNSNTCAPPRSKARRLSTENDVHSAQHIYG